MSPEPPTAQKKARAAMMGKYDGVLDAYLDGLMDKMQFHVRMFELWNEQYGEKGKPEPVEAVKT